MKSLLLAPPAKEEKVVSDGAAEFRDSFTHLIHNVEAIQCFFFLLEDADFLSSSGRAWGEAVWHKRGR